MEGFLTYNEAETRFQLIDPVLRAKGYRQWRVRLETPAPAEPLPPKRRERRRRLSCMKASGCRVG